MTEPNAIAALLAVLGLLLLLAGLASPLPGRVGVPALVLFLAVGVAAGSEGLGGIWFDDYELAFRMGSVALVLILFDGGLNTSPSVLRRVAAPALLLATVGVVATAAIVAGIGLLLGLSVPTALLVGAVVSSTDAAAVFSVLRSSGVRLRGTTGATLEVESGINDPMAMFLTVVATEYFVGDRGGPSELAALFGAQATLGVAGGLAVGMGVRWLLRTVPLPAAGLYPVATTAAAFVAFGVPTLVGGSGFLAVYLAGIVLGAGALPYRAGVRRVHDALAWLAQILMFVLLGLLVFPSRLVPEVPTGLALGLALAFVCRPLAVLAVLAPFRPAWREALFVSWVGLRGAVPIVLATYPVLRGVPGGDEVFHLVFFVVLVNSFVPGTTVGFAARRLGLARPTAPTPPASVELVSLREFPGEFVWYTVSEVSVAAGCAIRELGLPEGCVVVMVLRGDGVLPARGDTRCEHGDQLCIFATPESRSFIDLIFGGADEDRA